MALNDVYRVRVLYTITTFGGTLSNVLHIRQASIVAPDIEAVGDKIRAWWSDPAVANQKQFHGSQISLSKVQLQRVLPLEPVIFETTTGLPVAGTGSGDTDNPQCALVMSLRTAKAGKSFRGRAYLPPMHEGIVGADGNVSSTNAQTMANGFEAMRDAFESDSMPLCVFSRKLSSSEDVVRVIADARLRTQRRRQNEEPVYLVGV